MEMAVFFKYLLQMSFVKENNQISVFSYFSLLNYIILWLKELWLKS